MLTTPVGIAYATLSLLTQTSTLIVAAIVLGNCDCAETRTPLLLAWCVVVEPM